MDRNKTKRSKGYETLTHAFTKSIGDKTNQNKKHRRTQWKRRDQKMIFHPLTYRNYYQESNQ